MRIELDENRRVLTIVLEVDDVVLKDDCVGRVLREHPVRLALPPDLDGISGMFEHIAERLFAMPDDPLLTIMKDIHAIVRDDEQRQLSIFVWDDWACSACGTPNATSDKRCVGCGVERSLGESRDRG